MCGRYSLAAPGDVIAELFELAAVPDIVPRWNISPTQSAPVVRLAAGGQRELALLRWGLVPSWAKDEKIGSRMINARSETAAEKPSFRTALRRRRCLVVADGFYEWRKTPDGKVPTRVQRRDGQPFAFAGLWERWSRGAEPLETFTILTAAPTALLRTVHDRMPCILSPADHATWLDAGERSPERLAGILVPSVDADLEVFSVSTRVNSPRNDDAGCAAPA